MQFHAVPLLLCHEGPCKGLPAVCNGVQRRWHLAVTDRKDGKLYLYNGMLLLFLFFVSRVVLYGAGLLHLATLRHARLCVLAHLLSPAHTAYQH